MQGGREGTHSLLMRAVILSNMTGSLRPSRLTTFILGARRETASATRNVECGANSGRLGWGDRRFLPGKVSQSPTAEGGRLLTIAITTTTVTTTAICTVQ